MSAQQGNTYYSYWAADTYDADAPMQLTQGQYKDIVDTMWGNDAYLASSDVSKIKLEKVSEENKKVVRLVYFSREIIIQKLIHTKIIKRFPVLLL